MREAEFAGRSVWLLTGDRGAHEQTWRDLDAAYEGDGPCGLLTLLDVPDPDAEWADPRTLYVGRSPDGRQGRIAYFTAAVTHRRSAWAPEAFPFAVVPFATQSQVSADDVVRMWLREGALAEEEARRRVDEVLLVAIADGQPVGVTTRYLERNEQLGMDLWYMRVFVAASQRETNAATALAVGTRDHLEAAFVDGRDTRAAGMAMVVQSPILKRMLPEPVWTRTGVVLIAETARGDHVRLHYFAGAQVPAIP